MRSSLLVVLFVSLPVLGEPVEIVLWPNGAPGSESSSMEETVRVDEKNVNGEWLKSRWIQGVTNPTLSVFFPELEKRKGAAVLVCPGGGFAGLEFDKEGTEIARWLQGNGIVGVVLKYRLPDPESNIYFRKGALADAKRAIRFIRSKRDEWGIDSQRIGVVGFSAGGFLTAATGTLFDDGDPQAADSVERIGCRPDFIAPIYPLISLSTLSGRLAKVTDRILGPNSSQSDREALSLDTRVSEQTPPAFIVQAHDDYLSSRNSILFYEALKRENVLAEIHIYSEGGHGFGIRENVPGSVGSRWPQQWLMWMENRGFLNAIDKF